MHEPSDELPAEELELEGQVRHVNDDEDPTIVEYVPDPQSAQTADPFDALYFPAGHKRHVEFAEVPSLAEYAPATHSQEALPFWTLHRPKPLQLH